MLTLTLAFTLPVTAQDAEMHHKTMGAPSTQLTVTTGVGAPLVLMLADLQALPQQTIKVHNAHANVDETYSGPLLADVLTKAGLVLTEKSEHTLLHEYIIAKGTDGYWVTYSVAEVEPGLHSSKVIVALTRNGTVLTTGGQFQLANDMDKKPARWVHNVTAISVKTGAE